MFRRKVSVKYCNLWFEYDSVKICIVTTYRIFYKRRIVSVHCFGLIQVLVYELTCKSLKNNATIFFLYRTIKISHNQLDIIYCYWLATIMSFKDFRKKNIKKVPNQNKFIKYFGRKLVQKKNSPTTSHRTNSNGNMVSDSPHLIIF